MIDQAKKKVFPKNPYHYRVDLALMDSHALRFEDRSFDTVVDTFGLCSYDDPVAVLKEMARCCKGDGTILLIEHGKGAVVLLRTPIVPISFNYA
jgi:ubiquinone/menaquinone biosynthesis C-methylase UbiE